MGWSDAELFAALYAQSPLSTVVYDPSGHVTMANAAFERLFGLRASDLPSTYTIKSDPQLAAQGLLADVDRAFAGDLVVLPPVRYVATPSMGVTTTTWTQAHLFPLRDETGGIAAVVLQHIDLTDRLEAEATLRADQARSTLLAEAGVQLASSLDHGATLGAIARLVVPALADFCIIDLLTQDGAAVERVATVHVDASHASVLRELRRFPPTIAGDGIVARTLALGQPQLVSSDEHGASVARELDASTTPDPALAALLAQLAPDALLCVPLVARGHTLGTLLLASAGSGRRYLESDVPVAAELARRAALAVDNARLHQASVAAERAAAAYALDVDRFRRALAVAPDAFALFDVIRDEAGHVVDFVWNWANDAALRVQGTTLEVLRGERMTERNPGIRSTGLFAGYVRAVESGVTFEEEVHYRHEWIDTWFRVSAIAHDGGLALTFADVTSRRLAELRTTALYELTRALAVASTRSEVGDVVLDRAMPLLSADAANLLEYDAEADELVHIASRGLDASAMRDWQRYSLNVGTPGAAAIRSRELVMIADYDDWNTRYPQYTEWARAHGVQGGVIVPLLAGSRVLGIVSLHVPGTRTFNSDEQDFLRAFGDQCAQALERVRLFEAERRMRETAEAANRSKTEFLASMSHELRTPLNAIGGYTDLLLLGVRGPVTPAQALDLERINRGQRHLLSVINDILNFARVEAGFVEYSLQPVAVDELMSEVVPLVIPQLATKDIAFRFDEQAPGARVMADPEKVRQVLLNLLANAIKFTDEGGRVSISSTLVGDRVHIVVRDTGVGIPPDRLGAVFEPFVQLHRSITRPVDGTGLGLAISRDLARGMHGELGVESVVGEGSAFTLVLPHAPASDQ